MDQIKAFFADYKESILAIVETIANFIKALIGKELEGEDFAGIINA